MNTVGLSAYACTFVGMTDKGKVRSTNQDAIICCPEYGFFAVSDGMGGLASGGDTSAMLAKVMPIGISKLYRRLRKKPLLENAGMLASEYIRFLSDSIYESSNKDGFFIFGATLCAVWLLGTQAIFFNLGDSRAYLLTSGGQHLRQVTTDQNRAAEAVQQGILRKEEAAWHPLSSQLTGFVGMKSPARPEIVFEDLHGGDSILLCSDGLHSMVEDTRLLDLLHFSSCPEDMAQSLIAEANLAGGDDNIAIMYLQICSP